MDSYGDIARNDVLLKQDFLQLVFDNNWKLYFVWIQIQTFGKHHQVDQYVRYNSSERLTDYELLLTLHFFAYPTRFDFRFTNCVNTFSFFLQHSRLFVHLVDDM